MRKLLRHDIFHLGLLAGTFATLTVILVAGVILLWRAPWVVPFGQQPLPPQQIGMLRWDQQGLPIKVPVKGATRLSDVAFDGNHLWVTGVYTDTNIEKGAVFQVDPRTYKTLDTVILDKDDQKVDPRGVVFDGQHIWVANRGSSNLYCIDLTGNSTTATITTTPTVTATTTITTTHLKVSDWGLVSDVITTTGVITVSAKSPYYLAFDGEDIWTTDRDANTVWRLPAGSCDRPETDYSDTQITKINGMDFSQPFGIIFDGTYIWVANRGSNTVVRIDPSQCANGNCKNPRVIPIGDQGSQPTNLAYDGKYVWVTLQGTDQVARIEAETGWVIKPFIDVGRQPWGIAYDGAYIWVANNWDESVRRLRAADGVLVETFETDGAASRFSFDGTFMWITNFGDDAQSSFLTRR